MRFFRPNIGTRGRLIRGLGALLLLLGGLAALKLAPWLGGLLLASAALVCFEAFRGWCVLRACGIKTKF